MSLTERATLTHRAAGDRSDDADPLRALEARLQAVSLAGVDAVDVDVHERPQGAALVEHQVGDRQGAQRLGQARRVGLEAVPAAGLRREERREQDYGQSTTSTERIGGRWRASSLHVPSRRA